MLHLYGNNQKSTNLTVPVPGASPEEVLRDLAHLLEEYGPPWYTEEQHRRIHAALSSMRPRLAESSRLG